MNTSYFARIYLAIMERLLEKVPDLKYISPDLGQLEGYSQRPAVDFPCALQDFNGWVFESLGDNVQNGEGDVIIKLGYAQYQDSSNLTEPEWLEQSLSYWDIEHQVNAALHGWSPGDFAGYMTRIATITENRPMGVRAVLIRYRLAIEDYSTKELEPIGQRPALKFSSSSAGT